MTITRTFSEVKTQGPLYLSANAETLNCYYTVFSQTWDVCYAENKYWLFAQSQLVHI